MIIIKRQIMIWMAMMAVLMTVGFTSCDKEDVPSNDDDVTVDNVVDNETEDNGSEDNGSDDNPTPGMTKKLVRFAYENDYKYQTGLDVTFVYDEQGFLNEATQINSYGEGSMRLEHKFTWSENSIAIITEIIYETGGNSVENTTLTLNDGLVQNMASDDEVKNGAEYSYDLSGRLVKGKTYFGDETYIWNDAQLKSFSTVAEDYRDDYSFGYGENSTASGFCPLIPYRLTNIALYWAHPEIIGLMTNECPNKEMYESTTLWYTISNIYAYAYEYDDDGFVTKINETYEDSGEIFTGVYTMTWE